MKRRLLLVALAVAVAVAAVSPAAAAPSDYMEWDLFDDFRLHPDQANPGPDAYGNAGVWSYAMAAEDGLTDPSTYTLLSVYNTSASDWEMWQSASFVPFVLRSLDDDSRWASMHPGWPGREAQPWVIVGWTSPVTGTVSVTGTFSHFNDYPPPYDGIDWRIQSTVLGATSIEATGSVPPGGYEVLPPDLTFHVTSGDSLWLLVGPQTNSGWDQTGVTLTISTTNTAVAHLIEELGEQVEALNLPTAAATSLGAQIDAAGQLISDAVPHNDGAAIAIMEALLARLTGGHTAGGISAKDAAVLAAAIENIITTWGHTIGG